MSDTLEQARTTPDMAERTRLYHNFQYLFADQLPALPLYYPVYNYAVDEQVQGISVGPLFNTSDRLANITSWYMVTKRTSTDSE
jgi:peptide/nickel transport system substrate-binding protein